MAMSEELLTDLYEFSMANGYYATLPHDQEAVFDVFYRNVPDNGSFVIAGWLRSLKRCRIFILRMMTSAICVH